MFNFFNKKTLINDEFIQDTKSLLKLYPVKSFSAKPTKTNSGYKTPKAIADELSDNGGEIEIFFKHDLANNVCGYLIARENLLPVNGNDYGTFAFYLTSGKSNLSFYCDGSISGACVIPVSSLMDEAYYIAKLTVAATLSFTLQKVTKTGNLNTIGIAINSTTTPKGVTKANADMGIFAGCYSSGSLNSGSKHEIVYIKFKNNLGACISEVYFANGNENLVTDVCTGNNYTVLNEDNSPSFWNHKQDYSHCNFKFGHTLYKNGTSELRIPNKADGSEIVPASIPSGYARIANYKKAVLTWNKSESLVKLDDVSIAEVYKPLVSNSGVTGMDGYYTHVADNEGLPYYDNVNGFRLVYSSGYWWLATVPFVAIFRCVPLSYPVPYDISYMDAVTSEPVALTITNELFSSVSPLYTADVDHFLFTDGTGVAKEFDLNLIDIASISDRGYLYYNETLRQNFMLYATNKTLENDVKIIKYIGMSSRINYDESDLPNYDENNYVELTEV